MQVDWPKGHQAKYRVCHPVNSDGTTWLRESDLVFVKEQPYAVLKWSGEVPEVYIELKPTLLTHEGAQANYRYEGEVPDPTPRRRPA